MKKSPILFLVGVLVQSALALAAPVTVGQFAGTYTNSLGCKVTVTAGNNATELSQEVPAKISMKVFGAPIGSEPFSTILGSDVAQSDSSATQVHFRIADETSIDYIFKLDAAGKVTSVSRYPSHPTAISLNHLLPITCGSLNKADEATN